MKVIQLQYDTQAAGSAAYRLHKAFLNHGVESSLLSLYSSINTDLITQLGKRSKRIGRADQMLQAFIRKKIKPERGLYSYPIIGTDVSENALVKNADIIYFHWVLHGFLSVENIKQVIKLGKPVIFFMHDMWTITGGCHYSFDCEKYKTHCFDCPMFAEPTTFDWAYREFEKKLKLFASYDNVFFVSPSNWLNNCAKQSALTKAKPSFHIPNVLDRNVFKPVNKPFAKNILNIPENEIVIAFGAVDVTSAYKGWVYLKKALELLKIELPTKDISILVFGSEQNPVHTASVPFKIKFMGPLRDENSMVLVYNAADVFIAPSLADNLPYTIFEALSCGTPVVAFDTGGIPDMVIHKHNGYLAKYKDHVDLVEGIKYVIENKTVGSLTESFDTSAVIQKHLDLFDVIHSSKQ